MNRQLTEAATETEAEVQPPASEAGHQVEPENAYLTSVIRVSVSLHVARHPPPVADSTRGTAALA